MRTHQHEYGDCFTQTGITQNQNEHVDASTPSSKTRREFIKTTGFITASVAAAALPTSIGRAQDGTGPVGSMATANRETTPTTVTSDTNFDQWKDRKVIELATRSPITFTSEQAERHAIYSLALMAITLYYWNGNKYGRGVQYPLNETAPVAASPKMAADYIGHNIAALIVDGDGHIIDFDFNHNEIFNSSVEHAESRLLRRVFSLSQIHDSWDVGRKVQDQYYASELKNASLYTTLESCAQCSGIMALAQVEEVIFLQTDPGEYFVGNIMRNMTEGTHLQSPAPIPAKWFGLPHFSLLDASYQAFRARPQNKENAMVLDQSGNVIPDKSFTTSITSFLCTKAARDIFSRAAEEFAALKIQHPDWKPDANDATQLTNLAVLQESQHFVQYATIEARRGTPHRA
jgi:tRNA(Arg) A34 adenosine deaminase TadA